MAFPRSKRFCNCWLCSFLRLSNVKDEEQHGQEPESVNILKGAFLK